MDTVEKTMPEEGTSQSYEIVVELGQCYVSVGDYDKAKECFAQATTLDTDAAEPYVGLGVIAMQQQEYDDAELSFKVARRLDNKCAKAYCGLAMVYQQTNKLTEAFDNYLKSLEYDGDNMTALLGLFQTSCQMGSFAKVIYYLELYLQSHQNDVSVMFSLGSLYARDGKLLQAREMLKNVIALDTSNTDAANILEEVEHEIKNRNQ